MTDFSMALVLPNDLLTYYQGKPLVLKDCYWYEGPITLQALPYGGIKSVFHYHLIIYTKNGFLACDCVEYDGITMSSKEFIERHPNLVNQVLPN